MPEVDAVVPDAGKPDELWLADDGNFDLVVPASPFARVMGYVGGVVLILLGPALMVVLLAVGAFEWPSLVGGLAILVVSGGFGLASAMSTRRMQRRVERLTRQGRPATARVIGSRAVTLGEAESGLEVALVIEGPGVSPIRTRLRGKDHRIEALGEEFPVIVDPADGAYLIAEGARATGS